MQQRIVILNFSAVEKRKSAQTEKRKKNWFNKMNSICDTHKYNHILINFISFPTLGSVLRFWCMVCVSELRAFDLITCERKIPRATSIGMRLLCTTVCQFWPGLIQILNAACVKHNYDALSATGCGECLELSLHELFCTLNIHTHTHFIVVVVRHFMFNLE